MQAIWLYWFAAQQQTSTLRRQKVGFFYVKFNAEFNELFFWKFDFFQRILYTSHYLDSIV